MATLVVNFVADRDVDLILRTIERASGSAAAAKFERKLDKVLVRLTAFPGSGALRPKLGTDIRIGVVRPYVVIYKYDHAADVAEVLRVLDGRRNIQPRLIP